MAGEVVFQPGTGVAPATLVELTVGCRYICVVFENKSFYFIRQLHLQKSGFFVPFVFIEFEIADRESIKGGNPRESGIVDYCKLKVD